MTPPTFSLLNVMGEEIRREVFYCLHRPLVDKATQTNFLGLPSLFLTPLLLLFIMIGCKQHLTALMFFMHCDALTLTILCMLMLPFIK